MKLLKALGMPKFEFTWATMITLFRGLSAVGFLGWYTWNPSVWLAFWIGAMEMLDVVDGWVARRFNQGTDFGRWLDAVFDKAVLFGVLGVLLWHLRGENWLFYVVIGAIAMLDVSIARVSAAKEKRGITMKPTKQGKYGMFLRNSATVLLMMYIAVKPSGARDVLAYGAILCAWCGIGLGLQAYEAYKRMS